MNSFIIVIYINFYTQNINVKKYDMMQYISICWLLSNTFSIIQQKTALLCITILIFFLTKTSTKNWWRQEKIRGTKKKASKNNCQRTLIGYTYKFAWTVFDTSHHWSTTISQALGTHGEHALWPTQTKTPHNL